jgi:hypothetical protein
MRSQAFETLGALTHITQTPHRRKLGEDANLPLIAGVDGRP